jgi:hypothetical protein
MYSESTLGIISKFQAVAVEESGDHTTGRSFDPTVITGVINIILPLIQQLAALCNKTPPTPPPVPAELVAKGVNQEAYGKAFQSNWGAVEARNNQGKFRVAVVNRMAKQLADQNGTKKKLEKPAAIAALTVSYEESVDDVALAIQEQSA